MRRIAKLTFLGATTLIAATGVACASPTLSWNPRAVKLDGAKFTADNLLLGDYAQIVTSNGGLTFTDTGYLPIEGFSLAGQAITAPGLNDPSGQGWGAYVHYYASGTQTLSPYGVPATATYTQLSYQLIAYNGLATFGFGAGGAPVVNGNLSQATLLADGSLVSGQLAFVPGSLGAPSIQGTLSATVQDVPPQLSSDTFDAFDLSIVHPPGEYAFTSPSSIQIAAADGVTATLGTYKGKPSTSVPDISAAEDDPPATPLPEPASLAVLAAGLLGIGGLRWQRGKGA